MLRAFLALLATVSASLTPLTSDAQTLDAAKRREVTLAAARLIEDRYVYPDRAAAIAAELRSGADALTRSEPDAFASELTEALRRISGDGHFAVEHLDLPADPGEVSETAHAADAMERYYGAAVNHGFEAVRRLEGGVGYLDLRVFAPTTMGGDLAEAAMTILAQSPALIIDLRRNGGGNGDMVSMLQGYLLDGSVETSGTYDRPTDRLSRTFTPAWVPGRRYGGRKPLYILISNRTFSAAEAFAYDLQALGRAVIVGEASGGGAHPFEYRALPSGFILSLPEARSINPLTGRDWQGTGVKPDVPVAADQALDVALERALVAISDSAAP